MKSDDGAEDDDTPAGGTEVGAGASDNGATVAGTGAATGGATGVACDTAGAPSTRPSTIAIESSQRSGVAMTAGACAMDREEDVIADILSVGRVPRWRNATSNNTMSQIRPSCKSHVHTHLCYNH